MAAARFCNAKRSVLLTCKCLDKVAPLLYRTQLLVVHLSLRFYHLSSILEVCTALLMQE